MSHNTNMPQPERKGSAEGSFLWFVLTTPAATFTWVPGIELGPAGLHGKRFACRAISPGLSLFYV